MQLRIEQEKKTIELEHELLSAKLQAEHANLELPRLRTRVNELQAYTDVLKPASTGNIDVLKTSFQFHQLLRQNLKKKKEKKNYLYSLFKASSRKLLKSKTLNLISGRTAPPPPAAGKSVVELERVINAMKRVIEKLQKENAQMKSQQDSATKHKEVCF